MTIAPFFLVVHLAWSVAYGHSMTSVPMASLEACQKAAAEIAASVAPRRLTPMTFCVGTGGKP